MTDPKDKDYWGEILWDYEYDESMDNWEWTEPEGNAARPAEERSDLGDESDTPDLPSD